MDRTIRVKGTGQVSRRPDLILLQLELRTQNKEYAKAMALGSEKLEALLQAAETAGFSKKDLKTSNLRVETCYDTQETNGRYEQVFAGYACVQSLKLEMDYDLERLSRVISAIGASKAEPSISLRFGIKDKEAVSAELLKEAAKNARAKAEILAEASGVSLGELLNIEYNWGEAEYYSRTAFEEDCAPRMAKAVFGGGFEPEDVRVSDTAAFIWAMR